MLLLQHDSTGPVLCFHAIVLLKRAFPHRAEAGGEKWEGGLMSALPPKADMCSSDRSHARYKLFNRQYPFSSVDIGRG